MRTIEVSDEVYALVQQLAERCEWTMERVIHQALRDELDLVEMMEDRDLGMLPDLAG